MDEEEFLFFKQGTEGYREKIIKKEQRLDIQEQLYKKIRADKELRYPHKKILNFLIEKYDFEKKCFGEINFSKLIKDCHVGKNMGKEYLEFLIEKGYLLKRSDGYRIWYKINDEQ